MSDPSGLDDLLADRPDTVFLEGVGEVPVEYAPPPTPVFPDDRLCWAPGLARRELHGETVIFDVAARSAHVLNPTAGLLWQCMDGEGTVSEIFADVAAAFEVPLAAIEHDFVPVLSDWKRDGLVIETGTVAVLPSTQGAVAPEPRYLKNPPND